MSGSSRQPPALLAALGCVLAVGGGGAAPAGASSWSACGFAVTVRERTASHVRIHVGQFLGSDGSGRLDEASCRRLIGSSTIALSDVSAGAELLKPGARLHGRWSRYSAMTPSGPMSTGGWRFQWP